MVHPHKIVALALFFAACASGPKLMAHRYPKVSFDAFASAAVVPAKVESSSDLALPDALAEKLARMGFHIVDRVNLARMTQERGIDLREAVRTRRYSDLRETADLHTVVVVNTLRGEGVVNATCEVIDIESGETVLTATYVQSKPDHPRFVFQQRVPHIAGLFAGEFSRAHTRTSVEKGA